MESLFLKRQTTLTPYNGKSEGVHSLMVCPNHPHVGIGYRSALAEWTRVNFDRFGVLEITVDHCIYGGGTQRAEIFDLVGRIPLNAYGIGLSIDADMPPLEHQQGARQCLKFIQGDPCAKLKSGARKTSEGKEWVPLQGVKTDAKHLKATDKCGYQANRERLR
jgi:hypothetical protein